MDQKGQVAIDFTAAEERRRFDLPRTSLLLDWILENQSPILILKASYSAPSLTFTFRDFKMTSKEIVDKIRIIFSREKDSHPAWDEEVSRMSLDVVSELHDSKNKIEPELYKYLDDFDIRRIDAEYAKFQLAKVECILNSLR